MSLVNNAGDAQAGDLTHDLVWEHECKNIFLSAMRVTREFLRMPSSHLRKIISVTSLYGDIRTGDPQYLQYSAFKAALANFTTTISKSIAPKIIANAIAPGYTETPAWVDASNEIMDAHARATLIGRFVGPGEVAHAAMFVAENDALAGQVFTLDGGTSLKGLP